jgi:hemolysin activation/secretion protein
MWPGLRQKPRVRSRRVLPSLVPLMLQIGFLIAAAAARAQVPELPPSAVPTPIQRPPPEPSPPIDIPALRSDQTPPMAPPNAASIIFVLHGLKIEGASTATAASLTEPYLNTIGKQISLATVYAMADEMTRRYRNAGNFLSAIIVPQQRIEDGRVTLHLYEGKLAHVQLRGAGVDRRGLAQRTADEMTAVSPLKSSVLERQMLLLNDLPGMTARGTLVPSAEGLGFADLVIDTTQPRYRAELGADNRSGSYLGPGRYTAQLAVNSLFGWQDATEFDYATAVPADRFHTWTLQHSERLNDSGLALNMSYTDYRSQPNLGADFTSYNLETDSKTAFVDLTYPLIRSRRTNLSLRAGLRYHDGGTDSAFVGTATHDEIATGLVGLTFDYADAWRGVNTLDLELDKGLNAFGASRAGDPTLSRPGGQPDAFRTTLYIARLQDLGGHFSLLIAVTGQYAASRLLLPDEFAYGGEYFGRAYDAAEFVGDSGLAGKADLRYTWNATQALLLVPYAFYEGGWASRRSYPNDTVSPSESALSAGGGMRITFGTHLSGYVEAAKPINHIVAAEGNQKTRIFGGLKVSF